MYTENIDLTSEHGIVKELLSFAPRSTPAV